jgi:hypothetical protein
MTYTVIFDDINECDSYSILRGISVDTHVTCHVV